MDIGTYQSHSRCFNGTIDEVRIYSRALSADEIYEHYLEGDTKGNWHFDEESGTTAEDSSGNGNDGTLMNMDPDTCWVDGKIGKALEFDGVDDYVDCGNDASLDITDEITIEAWVKPISVSATGDGIVGKYHTSGNNRAFLIWINSGLKFGFIISDNGTTSGGHFKSISSTENATLNEWQHIVCVFSPSTYLRLYRDGVLDKEVTSTIPSGIHTPSVNLDIGTYQSHSRCFNGTIDEVRIYSRALSADEIYEHYLEAMNKRYCYIR